MDEIPIFLQKVSFGETIIYRGHADEKWELKPSIGRHYSGSWADVLDHESKTLDAFKKNHYPS